MKFSAQGLASLRQSLEDQMQMHRDGYNQALGALTALDHLEQNEQTLTEGQLEAMIGGRIDGEHSE